jgi:hypothetical protein
MVLTVEWGSIAEWVSGMGTLLAFLLAFVFGLRELRMQRLARRDDEMRQARLVIMREPDWFSRIPEHVYVYVHNFSDQPIYEVKPQITIFREGTEWITKSMRIFLIEPGKDQEFDFFLGEADEMDVDEIRADEITVENPYVYFLDNSGRRWRRSAGGSAEPERRFSALTGVEEYLVGQTITESDKQGAEGAASESNRTRRRLSLLRTLVPLRKRLQK